MFKGKKVIDVHGHLSTPPHFRAHAMNLLALRTPDEFKSVQIPEPAMNQALERHLRLLTEKNIDLQMISPRPVAMMHWERPFLVEPWSIATNDVIHTQCTMHPDRFVGIAQLPQTREMNIKACCVELERAIDKLGFVGALVNPDPGADRSAPGMDDEAWYPLYARAEQLQATLVVHPSITRDKRLERIPHSYQYNNLTEETLATLLLEHSDVFAKFPKLKIVICHCGGALHRVLEIGDPIDRTNKSMGPDNIVGRSGEQAGGQVGTGAATHEEPKGLNVSSNLYFDTCAYDPWYLGAAIRQRGVGQMVFGTEAPGSGSAALNPQTGKASDDVVAIIDHFDFLDDADKFDIFYNNPLKVFPLLTKVRDI